MEKIFIQEITKEGWTEQEGISSKGKRVKGWYERNNDGVLFLYKEPKIRDFVLPEIWTEFIAYKIGKFLNLDVPEVFPAKNESKYGVLIKSFIEFIMIKPSILETPTLVQKTQLGEAKEFLVHHNLKVIKGIFTDKSIVQEYVMLASVWENYKKMMIFDCLIGNSDRHDENWGICVNVNKKEFKLAPFYDNASCLTQQLNEKTILEYLSNKSKIEEYVNNSHPPNLYLNDKDLHRYTHYEIMKYLIDTEPDMKDLITELLQNDYTDYVDVIMANIQQLDVPEEYKLSDNRRKVILEILKLRRQKLKELL